MVVTVASPAEQRLAVMPSVQALPKQILAPEASAELRGRLLLEFGSLASGDDAALWAHRSLSEKNKLTAADAQQVEEAFEARLTVLTAAEPSPTSSGASRSITAQEFKGAKGSQALQDDRQERPYIARAAPAS